MPASLIDTLLEILRFESITGNEKPLCDWIESKLSKLSALSIQRIGNSLIVRGPKRKGACLAMAGHLDTVKGIATGDKVCTDGDKVIGLGASDMKAGVAIMLELACRGIFQESPYNIVQIYYAGEEGAYDKNEIHRIFKEVSALKDIDLCFVLEPTDSTLHLGCMGTMHAAAKFHGRRAHSARPWQGVNAIHLAAPLLARLADTPVKTVECGGLEFKEVISATAAHSGDNSKNVVPDIFTLNINYRFAPGVDVSSAKKNLLAVLNGSASVEFTDVAPACPVPEKNKFLAEFRRRFDLPCHPKLAYTDVAVFAGHGIAALNFGPGLTAQAHQNGEYVLASDVQKCFEILNQFLRSTC